MRLVLIPPIIAAMSATAWAQDALVVPAVPLGLPPVVTWLLGLVASIVSIFIPLIAVWFKQHLALQNDKIRADMINGSVTRAAQLADLDITQQHLTIADAGVGTPTMTKAIGYVCDSHPDAISNTPQATDEHIADAITAELHRIQSAKASTSVPSVILSPVSALR